jgi:hypothetical protein
VSDPADAVPASNSKPDQYFHHVFDVTDEILQDDDVLVLFFPLDNGNYINKVETFHENFGFAEFKSWMGGQRLPLVSALDKAGTTNKFTVHLLNRAQRSDDEVDWVSNFKFRVVPELQSRALTVDQSDMLINGLADPLCSSSGQSWRGSKEKDESFFNTLLLSLTNPRDVVVDLHAGTSTIYHCLFSCHWFFFNFVIFIRL